MMMKKLIEKLNNCVECFQKCVVMQVLAKLNMCLFSLKKQNYLQTKIKSCEGKTNRNFHNNEMPEKDSHCTCLSVTLIYSGSKMGKYYYRLVFLEKCECIAKFKGQEQFNTTRICKNSILPIPDYCLSNQLKLHDSIES